MKTYNLLENDKFAEIINKQSRLIGIDHGKKNIGISICDENHNIATPLTTIEFTQLKFFIIELRNIIKENNVEGIVVGNPINMDGSLGPRAQSARDFSKSLTEQLSIPVTLWDERLSSEGAYKGMSKLSINVTKKQKKLDENSAYGQGLKTTFPKKSGGTLESEISRASSWFTFYQNRPSIRGATVFLRYFRPYLWLPSTLTRPQTQVFNHAQCHSRGCSN